jgi:hypothetical protein
MEGSAAGKRVFSIEVERNCNGHVRIEVTECREGQSEDHESDKEV